MSSVSSKVVTTSTVFAVIILNKKIIFFFVCEIVGCWTDFLFNLCVFDKYVICKNEKCGNNKQPRKETNIYFLSVFANGTLYSEQKYKRKSERKACILRYWCFLHFVNKGLLFLKL